MWGDHVEILTGLFAHKRAFVLPWGPDIPDGHVRVGREDWVVDHTYPVAELRMLKRHEEGHANA